MAPTQEDASVISFSDLAATSVDTSSSSTRKTRPPDDAHPQPRSSEQLKRTKIATKPEAQYEPAGSANPPIFRYSIPGPILRSAVGFDNEKKSRSLDSPTPRSNSHPLSTR